MKPEVKRYSTQIGSHSISIETGKLAAQANGAVTVHLDSTMIFAAATMSAEARQGIDFFPLSVEYEERLYASGRIPGSFFRREGRPSTEAILTARLTDRPLRPLFPKGMRNDVQIIMYSLSADNENPIDILAINAASTALMISDIPWGGPVAAVRIGRVNNEFVVNPTFQQMETSDLDLRIAATSEAILMVECGAKEIPEETMVAALEFGHKATKPLIELQLQMAAEVGKPKREPIIILPDESIQEKVFARLAKPMKDLLDKTLEKEELYDGMDSLLAEVTAELAPNDVPMETTAQTTVTPETIKQAFFETQKRIIRERILKEGKRPDGRKSAEVRPIWCEVDISPRAHGSGLFTRGETQVLTLATLGTLSEAQELDTLSPQESKRYMHHYNFPPFSTGEVRPMRGASRREIGHGALAERALEPVIPPEAEFPYTLRLVSEVMSSNGSTSMASVCGSTLALMDSGVPIKTPIAGIAMGLIKENEEYAILTDILGIEDHLGDMDFKVAGSNTGITALQMDIKIGGLTTEIMSQALEQARQARLHVLQKMLETIPSPRPDLKPHAPRITTVLIPVDKIGALIGPGGKTVRALQEETDTKIDIQEDGTVYIAATNAENANIARERIRNLTEEPEVGHIYTGRVVRITDFGAFVEILPNVDGMVHISQLDSERVNRVEDIFKVGDEATVMVTDIDSNGKIRLSRLAVLEGWSAEEARERDQRRSGGGRPSSRSRSGGRRNDRRSERK